jgi:hypothetical protein
MSIYDNNRIQGYRMVVDASAQCGGMDPNIFVYQNQILPQGEVNTFTNVASAADMAEYPVGAPNPGGVWFRGCHIDLIFRNITLADDAWKCIKEDVDALINTLGVMETLEVQEVVVFGACDTNESLSSTSCTP